MAAAQPVCGFHPVVGRQWPAFGCQAAGNSKFGPARGIALGRATGDSVEKVWASQMLWPLLFRQNHTEPSIAVSIAIVFSSVFTTLPHRKRHYRAEHSRDGVDVC